MASLPIDIHPYPAYKPSGVPWLGDVPEHWDISAVKNWYRIQLGKMLQTVRETPNDTEVPYLKAVHVQWLSVQTVDPPTMWANPREIAQFGIQKGDLLVCEGGEGGRSGIVWTDVDGYIIQNAVHRIRPKGLNLNQYLQFVMYVAAAYGWFDALNAKATIAHFTRGKLAAFHMTLPPLSEQAAIVRYLDHVDRRIRRYVSAKRKLIALLEEEKQAIVNRTATRGLDSNVRLKPSGVEWLGDVPEHWEVRRGKRLFSPRRELARPDDIQLSATQAYGVIPQDEYEERIGRRIVKISLHLNQRHHVEVDDFVISMRSFQGGLERAWASGCIRSSYIVLRPAIEVDVEFFSYVFKSQAYIQALRSTANFIRDGQDLTFDNFCAVDLPFPPAEEQRKIAVALREATADISAAIARARRQIELVQEYRTRLIADVVTGKLDVRAAAAQLPDEGDDQDQIEEGDPLAHDVEDESLTDVDGTAGLVMEEERL